MTQSESIKSLLEAMAKAQSEFVTLPKDKSGYGYKYTDLDTVITTVRPILAKNGLGFMQSLTTLASGKSGITTRVFNTSGEWIEDSIALPDIAMAKTNAAQNLGAAITYMKRYALCAVLGISSDEDTDAVTQPAQNQQQRPQNQQQRPQKQNAPKGGPDTPAQHEAINKVLGSTYEDGQPVFNEKDIAYVAKMRNNNTADEVIKKLNEEAKKRLSAHAQKSDKFPEDIPYEQVSDEANKGAEEAFDLF